jgi:tagatose 6-phosphate kinase
MASAFIRDECAALGIDQRWVDIVEETRTCVIVVDPESGSQTVINESGPTVTAGEVEWLLEEIEYYVEPGDFLSISGSAAPGAPADLYARIVRQLRARGVNVLADVSGDELRSVTDAHPWALAPNVEEAAAAFGMRHDPHEIARRLASFTDHVLLTRASEGVLYAAGDTMIEIMPPRVQALNAVGSGDALVAGFLTGVSRGMSLAEAVRLGVACGAANAERFEQGIGSVVDIERLLT